MVEGGRRGTVLFFTRDKSRKSKVLFMTLKKVRAPNHLLYNTHSHMLVLAHHCKFPVDGIRMDCLETLIRNMYVAHLLPSDC